MSRTDKLQWKTRTGQAARAGEGEKWGMTNRYRVSECWECSEIK